MIITKKNIFEEAKKGNLEVLKHKDVLVVKDSEGWTPLHWLLAKAEKVEVLNHKDISVVKDNWGFTPLHYLAFNGKVPRKYIKDTYPWFKLGIRKIDAELITEILNTCNTMKFIFEEDKK